MYCSLLGNYVLKVNGYSYMTDAYAEEDYVVSKSDCGEPWLSIDDSTTFYDQHRQVRD